jgi:uncharacterized membrane protein
LTVSRIVAITLLVLEISVPSDAGEDLLKAVLDQWPSSLAYLVSFATIGVTWLPHTTMTHHLHKVDSETRTPSALRRRSLGSTGCLSPWWCQ